MTTTWLNREEAAEWLNVSVGTITHIVNEMQAKGLPGIWRDGRHFLRINKNDMNEYLRTRRFTQ